MRPAPMSNKQHPFDKTGLKVIEKTKAYGDDFGVSLFSDSTNTITPRKAMAIETVYSCIRDKSETVGRLPVCLYDKSDDSVERVTDGRLHKIFTQRPNDFMTMQGFLEFMTASYELYGAFYAYASNNDRGNIMELIPFKHQQNVKPAMDHNGNVYYTYVTNDGQPNIAFGIDDIFVINQFTLDGFTPVSPIQYNAALLNGTYDTEDTWNTLQSEGVTAQFALKTDKSVSNEAASRLKNDWKTFRGAPGVGNIPVLEDGMDLKSLQLSPKDAELLESRGFSVNRICRIFRVPPERIGEATKTSSNQTMLDIDEAYMRNGIEPILMKYENACNIILCRIKSNRFVRINRKAFYNGSPHRMVEAVGNELKIGIASVNEARIDLGRDPVDGGDVFALDTNNLTFGKWNELKSVQEQINNREQPQGEPNEE